MTKQPSALPFSDLPPVPDGSGQPLHRQVENWLRQLAKLPQFRDGSLLPDELTLANRLGVSRGTARAALGRLVHEGILQRRAGIGTWVAPPPAEFGIRAWRSFSREMRAKGIEVVNFVTDFQEEPAPEAAAKGLRVPVGSLVRRLDRVRGWSDKPVLISRSWFHPRLHLDPQTDWSDPLYEVIERQTGVVAEGAREEFSAVSAGAWLARRLAVKKGAPLLFHRHVVTDTAGRPLEHAEIHYVSSRFILTVDMRRETR